MKRDRSAVFVSTNAAWLPILGKITDVHFHHRLWGQEIRRFRGASAIAERCPCHGYSPLPRSTAPELNGDRLGVQLPESGIRYVTKSDTLGGFHKGGYPKYTESDLYQAGISKLLELTGQGNVVLMCKERHDTGCHRGYIVETLTNKGIKTIPLI